MRGLATLATVGGALAIREPVAPRLPRMGSTLHRSRTMTDRDDRSLQRETGQENPLGDADVIDSRHGRHGGSEESEGAPQSPPKRDDAHVEPHDRGVDPDRADPSRDRNAR